MGARPMQRIIQDTVRKALADELLFGRLAHGGSVLVDIDDAGTGSTTKYYKGLVLLESELVEAIKSCQ